MNEHNWRERAEKAEHLINVFETAAAKALAQGDHEQQIAVLSAVVEGGARMCTEASPCPTCECAKVLRDVWEKAEAQGMKCVYCGGPCSDGCLLDKWVKHHETEVWTQDQVDSLNAWQDCGRYHPFTSDNGQVLVATRQGWVERLGGPVVQTWAHTFMLDWSWKSSEI